MVKTTGRAYLSATWENFQRADGSFELTHLWKLYPPDGDGSSVFLGKVRDLSWEEAFVAAKTMGLSDVRPLTESDRNKGPRALEAA